MRGEQTNRNLRNNPRTQSTKITHIKNKEQMGFMRTIGIALAIKVSFLQLCVIFFSFLNGKKINSGAVDLNTSVASYPRDEPAN